MAGAGVGWSSDPDPIVAGQQSAQQALQGFVGQPGLALVFCTVG